MILKHQAGFLGFGTPLCRKQLLRILYEETLFTWKLQICVRICPQNLVRKWPIILARPCAANSYGKVKLRMREPHYVQESLKWVYIVTTSNTYTQNSAIKPSLLYPNPTKIEPSASQFKTISAEKADPKTDQFWRHERPDIDTTGVRFLTHERTDIDTTVVRFLSHKISPASRFCVRKRPQFLVRNWPRNWGQKMNTHVHSCEPAHTEAKAWSFSDHVFVVRKWPQNRSHFLTKSMP